MVEGEKPQATATAPAGWLEELGWLDVRSSYSRVRSLAYPVDPMRRLRGGAPARFESRGDGRCLATLSALSEWAYGYQARQHSVRPLGRRAASAGALYPTETMVLAHFGGAWQLLHHDYLLGAPRMVDGVDASSLAALLGLHEGEQALLLVTVLWRSAQRYGARSYLYALLDAGHVAANFAQLTAHFGGRASVLESVPTRQMQTLLGLRAGEALVGALRLALPTKGHAVPPPPAASLASLATGAVLQPPALSPLLRRVDALHRRSLSPPPVRFTLGWLAAERPAQLLPLLERRRSAVAFGPEGLRASDWTGLSNRCLRSLDALRADGGPALWAYALTPRVEGCPPQAIALTRYGPQARSSFSSADDAAAALREACQAQAIAAQAAATIVIGLPLAQLPHSSLPAFRVAALCAGAVCADLYLEAGRRGVGTTSIGGFDAALLQALLGDAEICPLVAQAFGTEVEGGSKRDTVPVADSGDNAGR